MRSETGNGFAVILGLALAVAMTAGVIYALYLIGSEALTIIAQFLCGAIGSAIVLAALSLPIRAWRKNDAPPVVEKHFYDGTRTIVRERIDGRAIEAPKLYQLPAAAGGDAFPELLRAAYQAGVSSARPAEATFQELQELDPQAPGGWSGEIRP